MKKLMLLLSIFVVLNASRLVVLDPAAIEIIFMLKAQDQIVAISRPSSPVWPEEETKKLPNVGTYIKPSLEKIVELSPDLVITSLHSSSVSPDLNKLGIKTINLDANSIDEIYKNVTTLGEITHKQSLAKQLNADLHSKLKFSSKLKGKKAIVLFSGATLLAFSSGTLPADLMDKMGLVNIAKDLKGKTPAVQTEYILEQNPDFIILMGDSKELLKFHPILAQTNAAKNGKIISVSSSQILRGSLQIGETVDDLYREMEK